MVLIHNAIGAIAALLLAGAASSQSAPAPPAAKADVLPISDRMDAYFRQPRAVATLRALNGLGDPGIHEYPPLRSFNRNDDEKRLVTLVSRQTGESEDTYTNYSSQCRLGYAASVLAKRIKSLGPRHPYVTQLLRAEGVVMGRCSKPDDATAERSLPAPLRLADPKLARIQAADRAYQSAALSFYQGKRQAARAAFARIAASRSPHRATGAYMVAAIDAGTQPDIYRSGRSGARVAAALRESRAILADTSMADAHLPAHELIGWLGATVDDQETRTAQIKVTMDALEAPLAALATDPVARERYTRANDDIDKLHSRFDNPAWWIEGSAPDAYHASRAMAQRAKSDDAAAWLLVPVSPFQERNWALWSRRLPPGWDVIGDYARARSERGAEWSTMLAGIADKYDPAGWENIDSTMAEALRTGGEQSVAALPFLFYHQVRTTLMYGDAEDRAERFTIALQRLKEYPWKKSDHYQATVHDALRYLMASGRIADARRLRDTILGPGKPADYRISELLLLLAEDEDHLAAALADEHNSSSSFLDRLSGDALARLAARPDLPPDLRARFARVAWTRRYALGLTIDQPLDRMMRDLNPDLTKDWSSRPGHTGPNDESTLLDVLRSPGLNLLANSRTSDSPTLDRAQSDILAIDTHQNSDNDWWCSWQPERHRRELEATLSSLFWDDDFSSLAPEAAYHLRRRLDPLLGASAIWQKQDPHEEAALAAIDSAPKLLSERAIAWTRRTGLFGRRRGRDEALALAVRTTRFGCQRNGSHAGYSRAAFQLLHDRFPDSVWARRTKYWFGCSHFTYGCAGGREEDTSE